MSKQGVFITGTDTDVGKTVVSAALARLLAKKIERISVFKPVSAGCELHDGEYRNEDALQLIAASQCDLPYLAVNPIALAPPIAPNIAAEQIGRQLTVAELLAVYHEHHQSYSFTIVEGAGGWLVPLNNSETLATLAEQLALPVIMVVGVRLGCISHALLTAAAIKNSGLTLAGWVANCVDPNASVVNEQINTLGCLLGCELLATIPHLGLVDDANVDAVFESQFSKIQSLISI